MAEVIDYGTPSTTPRLGWAYPVLVVLNLAALVASAWLLMIGASGDSYAPLISMVFGIPFVCGEGLLICLPSLAYAMGKFDRTNNRAAWTLVVLAGTPLLVSVTAIFLAVGLPTTHGSTC